MCFLPNLWNFEKSRETRGDADTEVQTPVGAQRPTLLTAIIVVLTDEGIHNPPSFVEQRMCQGYPYDTYANDSAWFCCGLQ